MEAGGAKVENLTPEGTVIDWGTVAVDEVEENPNGSMTARGTVLADVPLAGRHRNGRASERRSVFVEIELTTIDKGALTVERTAVEAV